MVPNDHYRIAIQGKLRDLCLAKEREHGIDIVQESGFQVVAPMAEVSLKRLQRSYGKQLLHSNP